MHPVTVVVVHAEEVIHVTGIAPGTTTKSHRADGRAATKPVRDIDVVDMLLDKMVTGERYPVLPAPHQVITSLGING